MSTKPKKQYKIAPGELKSYEEHERYNIRYRAKKEGWKIKIRLLNGELLVFRES